MENLICASCKVINCMKDAEGEDPKYCPTITHSEEIEKSFNKYSKDPFTKKIALAAARVEGEGYGKWTRVKEAIEFAKKIEAKKIGIATCIGLLKEAQVLTGILEKNGFQVESICCKAGKIDKTKMGLNEDEKVRKGLFEPICNPVAQARILNDAKTDLNLVVGLCIGHDILFLKNANAPSTVLIVKDRVLGHNPAAAIYLSHSYYQGK